MVASVVSEGVQTLLIEKEVLIVAPLEIAFEALLEEIGPASEGPGGQPMPMVSSPGREAAGSAISATTAATFGVTFKSSSRPALLEISGPLFMSYPCMNHLQYRLMQTVAGPD